MDVSRFEGSRPSHAHLHKPLVKKLFPCLFPSKPLLGSEFLDIFERDVSVFGDNQTMQYGDFKRIVSFINAHSKKLFRNRSCYYRREDTGLSHSFQVHMPPEPKNVNEMNIFIHLKSPESTSIGRNVHTLNRGAEKLIKLSLLIDIQCKKISFCATGTHRSASKRNISDRSQKQLLLAAKKFQNEIDMLELFKGREGVLQLRGHVIYSVKGSTIDKAPKINMIFEYADEDLLQYMNSIYRQALFNPDVKSQWESSPIRKKIVIDLLTGLSNIHDQNVVHGDVKLDNILLCDGSAKLGDFGFARNADKKLQKLRGTAIFLSPELLRCVYFQHEIHRYPHLSPLRDEAVAECREWRSLVGKKTDVYSLGVCFHFVKYLKQPDYLIIENCQKENSDILDSDLIGTHIRDLEAWYKSFQPDDAEGRLIKQMMNLNPDLRISTQQALSGMINIYSSVNSL